MYPDNVMEPDGPERISVEEHREMLGCDKCRNRATCGQNDEQFNACHEGQSMDELYHGGM